MHRLPRPFVADVLQAGRAVSKHPIIGHTADYQTRFSRQHSGEPPEPMRVHKHGWWFDIACGGGLILFMVAGFIVMDKLADVMCWLGWAQCL